MPDSADQIKILNRWVARVVPVILIAIVGYVTWVIVVSVCVKYLLYPHFEDTRAPRPGAAASVLVIYSLLFLLVATAWFRLLLVVLRNPGYVERSTQYYDQKAEKKKLKINGQILNEKYGPKNDTLPGPGYSSAAERRSGSDQPAGLEDFIRRDVFVCQGDGRPIWCTNCQNWKPDRAHHCREVDRCVRKMDHFCPWVGGVVSETSFKFFIHFVGWAGILCIYILILVAILLDESVPRTGNVNIHWVVTLALAGVFGLFTVGMFGSSMRFVLLNTTTIENLSRQNVVYQLAIHMPRLPSEPPPFPTITYSTAQAPLGAEAPPGAMKAFAILHTRPGDNPWDLGVFNNFKEVMGDHWYDWFLPFKYSPCTNHNRYESHFPVGPAVWRMKKEAGITSPKLGGEPQRRRRHRRRRFQETSKA